MVSTAAFDPQGDVKSRDAYAYLKGLPAGGALELPFAPDLEAEFSYQYLTLIHGHPVVNGHSGYLSPLSMFLGGGHSPLNELDHLAHRAPLEQGVVEARLAQDRAEVHLVVVAAALALA